MDRIEILGVGIDNVTNQEALTRIESMIESGAPHQIVTPAIDQVIRARRDPEFNLVLCEADLVVPDGMQLVFASKLHKTPLKERVTGVDLVPQICKLAAEKGYSIFFMGGDEGVADETARVLKDRFPGLTIAGTYYPPYKFEEDPAEEQKAIDQVRSSNANVLFLAISSPRQEKWLRRRKKELGVSVCVGVGGAFNFITGKEKRAPKWLQNLGMEGLYRLIQRPREIWKRVFISVPYFFALLLDRLSYKKQKQTAQWLRLLILAAADMLLAPALFLFSYWFYFRSGIFSGEADPFADVASLLDMPVYSDLLLPVSCISVFALWLTNLYRRDKYLSAKTVLYQSLKAAAWAFLLLLGFQEFVFKDLFVRHDLRGLSRVVIGVFGASFFIVFAAWRCLFRGIEHTLHRYGVNLDRIIIVGDNENTRALIHEFNQHPEYGLQLLGYITTDSGEPCGNEIEGVSCLGGLGDLERLLPARKVDEVLITDGDLPLNALSTVAQLCRKFHTAVSVIPTMHQLLGAGSEIKRIGNYRVVSIAADKDGGKPLSP